MTDFQFRAVIKMVIGIVSGCKSIEEAVEKLYGLINEKAPESDSWQRRAPEKSGALLLSKRVSYNQEMRYGKKCSQIHVRQQSAGNHCVFAEVREKVPPQKRAEQGREDERCGAQFQILGPDYGPEKLGGEKENSCRQSVFVVQSAREGLIEWHLIKLNMTTSTQGRTMISFAQFSQRERE